MPRTKLICTECKKPIPVKTTKQGLAEVIILDKICGNVQNPPFKMWFCSKKCRGNEPEQLDKT